jgi:hypothetical protein
MSRNMTGSNFFCFSLRGVVLGFLFAIFFISAIASNAPALPLMLNKGSTLPLLHPKSQPPGVEITVDGALGKPSQYGLDQLMSGSFH